MSGVFKYLDPVKCINAFCVSMGLKIRKIKLFILRKKIKNKDFTILTENCLAGVIYHDFDMQFRSPLINGEFSTTDFIKFLQRPKYYMEQELVFVSNNDKSLPEFCRELNVPVARLGDLYYRFTHYQMPEEKIRAIWNKRKARINWDNIYVVLCEKKGCTLEHMKIFETLSYKYKVIFTCHNYPDLKYGFHVKGFEKIGYIDNLLKDVPTLFPISKKYYDQFDFVTWFNTGKIQKQ